MLPDMTTDYNINHYQYDISCGTGFVGSNDYETADYNIYACCKNRAYVDNGGLFYHYLYSECACWWFEEKVRINPTNTVYTTLYNALIDGPDKRYNPTFCAVIGSAGTCNNECWEYNRCKCLEWGWNEFEDKVTGIGYDENYRDAHVAALREAYSGSDVLKKCTCMTGQDKVTITYSTTSPNSALTAYDHSWVTHDMYSWTKLEGKGPLLTLTDVRFDQFK